MKSIGVLLATLFLAACVVRHPKLYPDNDTARAVGPLQAKLIGHGNLNGTITTTMPDGEVLEGRYSINLSGEAMADMDGPKKTTAHCEFMNNNFTGHGHGICRISNGALYRMQY